MAAEFRVESRSEKMGNIIKNILASLKRRLPGARIHVDEPLAKTGIWHVDVSRGEHAVVLQWSPQKGFGISADPTPAFGEGPHEVYDNLEKAVDRAVHLVDTGEHTHPPHEAWLGALRDLLGISQEELAERLKMRQASVSKLERRSDMRISTLDKLVQALGADLQIGARVGETQVTLTQFKQTTRAKTKHAAKRKRVRA